MRKNSFSSLGLFVLFVTGLVSFGCQPSGNVNTTVNSNANAVVSNAASNLSNANIATTGSTIDAREPEQYQATIKLTMEALGEQQKTSLPPVTANVARSGGDRVMEFTLPNGDRVIYLDKGATHYVILPNRRQYAEINRETLGVDIRRLLTPEQIVNQVKNLQGVQKVGEENVNGRTVVRYTYGSTTNTQSQAGQVNTEAYVLVDKETGLPLRSETVAQSTGNVQGYKGMRLVTEMSNIKSTPDAALFNVPTDFARIEPEQIRNQMNMVAQMLSALVGQAIQQSQQAAPANSANTAPANR
jgi:hypothetical protein